MPIINRQDDGDRGRGRRGPALLFQQAGVQAGRQRAWIAQQRAQRERTLATVRFIQRGLGAQFDADSRPAPDWVETALRELADPRVHAVTGPGTFYDIPGLRGLLAVVLVLITTLPLAAIALIVIGGPAGVGSSMLYASLRTIQRSTSGADRPTVRR